MRKLIFVNRYFSPDESATSQLLSDLAFDLAAAGYRVEIVTSRQRYEDAARNCRPRADPGSPFTECGPRDGDGGVSPVGRLIT